MNEPATTPPLSRTPSRLRSNAPDVTEPPAVISTPAGEPPPPTITPPAPELPMIEDVQPQAAASPVTDHHERIAGSDLRENDIVQVIDPSHRHYGVLFTVGDVKHDKVHGYYMTEGVKKEFITVPLSGVFHILAPGPDPKRRAGTSKVRARSSCSPKWLSDNQ